MFKLVAALMLSTLLWADSSLPSWKNGASKRKIIDYVSSVTDRTSAHFIPQEERIAVFDNDGTLWAEQPLYFQLYFAFERIHKLAPSHPEWKEKMPFKAVLEHDKKAMKALSVKDLLTLVNATHSDMDIETFQSEVSTWIKNAKHPTTGMKFTQMVYKPMMELIVYLKAHNFNVYIVSGGGIDFMRAFVPEHYGIPKEKIIGSNLKSHYENGKIIKDAMIHFINDKELKPVAINDHIGKRPVAAFGNSDGDLAMMQYTEANSKYKTLQLYVHHTDAKREFAYDRKSHVGKLDKGLDYGKKQGWVIVDMKNEWRVVY